MKELEGYTAMFREWDTGVKISEVKKYQLDKNLGGGLEASGFLEMN